MLRRGGGGGFDGAGPGSALGAWKRDDNAQNASREPVFHRRSHVNYLVNGGAFASGVSLRRQARGSSTIRLDMTGNGFYS